MHITMDTNDPSVPLLGHVDQDASRSGYRHCLRKTAECVCSVKSWRRRLPIVQWLPQYSLAFLLRDAIAGITVGLTSVPQGIAYAILAGLPPQYGLYSSMFPGFVYMVFGSCKDVTVGPTAILAVLVSKYVAYSTDFAILAAFLSGCFILLLGILHLGFLLDFISKPVINGFTTAAALQIAASQLKPLFRIAGSSGGTFVMTMIHFVENIKTAKLWDPLLGFGTIIFLVLFKKGSVWCVRAGWVGRVGRSLVRARNAAVVAGGATLAYCLHRYAALQPFALTGKIEGGLPHFAPPPFSTTVHNVTYNFPDMMAVFGAEGMVMPLVAILESIAIAKAFAGSASVDASQEMVAVGACNVVSAFCCSMPVTGSFTRTAINHDCGVATPAGGLFKGALVLLSLSLLSPALAWIPRATLAAVIIVAMLSILTVEMVPLLWKHSRWELAVFCVTAATGVGAGLEYGILGGALADLARLLAKAARPRLQVHSFRAGHRNCVLIELQGDLSYCCAEYFSSKLRGRIIAPKMYLILDGRSLHSIDIGVAENLIGVIQDLETKEHQVLLWHLSPEIRKLLEHLQPSLLQKFTNVTSIEEHLIGAVAERNNVHV